METSPSGRGTFVVEHPTDDVALVRLLGEHDLTTAAELETTLNSQIDAGQGLVVSVDETQFIDSTVLRTLFYASAALRRQDRSLAIHVNTASIVRRTFELVSFEDVAYLTPSLAEAVAVASHEGSAEPSTPS